MAGKNVGFECPSLIPIVRGVNGVARKRELTVVPIHRLRRFLLVKCIQRIRDKLVGIASESGVGG